VLEGAKALLKEAPPPMMLMEFYPKMLTLKSVDPGKVVQAIYDAGYRIYDCQSKVGEGAWKLSVRHPAQGMPSPCLSTCTWPVTVQTEVEKGAAGLRLLDRYKETVTDLLLLHASKVGQSKLKKYKCGY
jgi:hypothetical protein